MPAAPSHDHAPRVTDVCDDDLDVLALSIIRFVASGYMTGDVACWEAAHDGAERLLGAAEGGRVVAALVVVMRAIRRERRSDWRFMPATCCRVTADERELVTLIGAARRGGDVGSHAAQLAGSAAPGLAEAARRAAAALADAAPCLVRDRTPARAALH